MPRAKQRKPGWEDTGEEMEFKVKVGIHIAKDPENPGQSLTYEKGDTFTSTYELDKRWPEKFERVNAPRQPMMQSQRRAATEPQQQPVQTEQREGNNQTQANDNAATQDDNLDEMTVIQLRQVAAKEHVDLSGARTKEEIVERIRKARDDDND